MKSQFCEPEFDPRIVTQKLNLTLTLTPLQWNQIKYSIISLSPHAERSCMNVLCKTETQTAKCKASKCTVSSSTKSIPTNPNSEPKYEPKPGSDRVPGPHKCMQVPYVLVLVPMQVPMNACMISGASATHEEIRAQCSPANIRQVLPPCQNRRAIRHR